MGTPGRGYNLKLQEERAKVDLSFIVPIQLDDQTDVRFVRDPEARKAGECVSYKWTPEQVQAEMKRLRLWK